MDYSLIICTYNPDPRILLRCFSAVSSLLTDGFATEVIVVDNNSPVPLDTIEEYRPYLNENPGWTLLCEKHQGVQFARIAAIKQAKGKHLVYIDYDNEPASDYLVQLHRLIKEYPQVAAWGPGQVKVEFMDGIAGNIENYARTAFQQRNETAIRTAAEPEWQSCYPFGTGLCTRADVLKNYVTLAEAGHFTLEGRSGQKLTSGEDTQMVLLCIKMGYSAGVSPQLKITHLIPDTRANVNYLKRLAYGTSICYPSCLVQVFPEKKQMIEQQKMPRPKLVRRSLKGWLALAFNKNPLKSFALSFFLGNACSNYVALNEPVPWTVRFIIRRLELE